MNPAIERAKAETRLGRCICCGERLPPRHPRARSRVICPDRDCMATYNRLYKSGQREESALQKNPPTPRCATCATDHSVPPRGGCEQWNAGRDP